MRQLFSRVFDLALGAATALLVIGAASEPDLRAGRGTTDVPLANAYSAEVVSPPPALLPAPGDPAAQFLVGLVAQGRQWRLDTENGPIRVWIPEAYDPATAHVVLYVHGYWQDVDTVWHHHHLPEQFALAGVNAVFVVAEAPRGKWDKVLWPTARAVLDHVRRGVADLELPEGKLAVIGHSGAYRTVIQWLGDPSVETVVLLDAAYVDVKPYRDWVVRSKHRRFVNVAIDTIRWSNYLHRWLPGTVTIEGFPCEITEAHAAARILYIKSDLDHWALVTDGIALPGVLRMLRAPRVLGGDDPPLGLPAELREQPEVMTE